MRFEQYPINEFDQDRRKLQEWKDSFREGIVRPKELIYLPGGLAASAYITCAFFQCLIDLGLTHDGYIGSSAPSMIMGYMGMGRTPQEGKQELDRFDMRTVRRSPPFPTIFDNKKLLDFYAKFESGPTPALVNNATNPDQIQKDSFKMGFVGYGIRGPVFMSYGRMSQAIAATGAYPGVYMPFNWENQWVMDGDVAPYLPREIGSHFQNDNFTLIKITTPGSRVTGAIKRGLNIATGHHRRLTLPEWAGTSSIVELPIRYDTSKFGPFSFGHPDIMELYDGAYEQFYRFFENQDKEG